MVDYQAGNIEVLEEIFQRYKVKMFNYSLRLLGNRADAEDVVGQAFYILTSKKDAYKPQARFSTWFYTIAHNLCIDRLRKRKRVVFMWFKKNCESNELEQWDIPDPKDLANSEFEKNDLAGLVKKAIWKLPLGQKEAVILREYQGLSYEEIGKILECSRSKVKILIFRARQRLKKQLLPVLAEVNNV